MYNDLHLRYKSNDNYDVYEHGYLMKNGAISEYLEKVDFVKNNDEFINIFAIDEVMNRSGIKFGLKDKKNASKIFLNSLLEFLCLPNNLLHKNNRVRTDYVSCVLNSKYLIIDNAIVDQNLLLLINRFFNNLDEIIFKNCLIKTNCCFNQHEYQIMVFDSCQIESLRCLNDLKSYSLGLHNCLFNNISNTTINVKRLNLQSDLDLYYENIFVNCYFPKLDSLYLRGYGVLDKSLMFLPSSCPNIYNLSIFASNIKDRSYLYNLPNLLECDIYLLEDIENDIDVRRNYLKYSQDEKDIYLNKKLKRLVYKKDELVDDNYYLMFDGSIKKEMLLDGDRLYSWKNASWINKTKEIGGIRRKISPVICPKPSIIHPTGKVLFLSTNPYNYK